VRSQAPGAAWWRRPSGRASGRSNLCLKQQGVRAQPRAGANCGASQAQAQQQWLEALHKPILLCRIQWA